ncbi:hypothetical protein Sjap_017352 [Stephania japonica]|uniref:Uncharacterized protein n=1 Tax=Stephania japonica TaxID=461633 RepID=A0AAP0I5Z9_9MAGN
MCHLRALSRVGPVVESLGVRVYASDEVVEWLGHSSPSFYYSKDILVPGQPWRGWAPPPLRPPAWTTPGGPPAVGQRATAPCPAAVEAEEGWQPPLSSPLHGLYGVGKEEPPSGTPTPLSPARMGLPCGPPPPTAAAAAAVRPPP